MTDFTGKRTPLALACLLAFGARRAAGGAGAVIRVGKRDTIADVGTGMPVYPMFNPGEHDATRIGYLTA